MPFVPRRLHLNRNKGRRSHRRLESSFRRVHCLVSGGSIRLATKAARNSDTAHSVNASKPRLYDESEDPCCLWTGSVDNKVASAGAVSAGVVPSEVKGTEVGVRYVRTGRDSSAQSEWIASWMIWPWFAWGKWFESVLSVPRASGEAYRVAIGSTAYSGHAVVVPCPARARLGS